MNYRVATVLFVMAIALSSPSLAQTLSLFNGGFEFDSPVVSPPSGWTLSEGSVYVTSGEDLSPVDPLSAYQGNNFVTMNRLAAGDNFPNAAQSMSMFQSVDLTSFSTAIDVGDRFLDLSFAYNSADASDNGIVSFDFFDGAGLPLGASARFDTLSQPTQSNAWATHSLFGQVPAGAREVQFSLTGERVSGGVGSARNVSFDNVTANLVDAPIIPPRDVVNGNLIQFADNGAWSWFQDERAIVDQENGELIVGYMANRDGVGGESVDGHVMTTHFDLATGARRRYVHNDLESYGGGDDHNVPALLKKSDGEILSFYAAHNSLNGVEDDRSYYRTYSPGGQTWGSESEYHWWDVIPNDAPGNGGTTYSNVFQLASEDPDGDGHGRIYNIARTQQSPHIMYSDDNGATWNYGGQLTTQNSSPPPSSYVNGYYKYTSNGEDRIDFIATEYHPRDYNTSIYHAYIEDGKLHNSEGVVIDDDIFDAAGSFSNASVTSTDDFTKVFQAGNGSNSRAWTTDIQNYEDGTIVALWKARAGGFGSHSSGSNDHRVWYGRFDPAANQWSTSEIAQAGGSLFGGSETDYTGLGAIHPSDPNTLYISTEVHPVSSEPLAHHEIFKGVTADNGATWSWEPVTENSSYDNLRPIIPAWDDENTAVIWWRGTMNSSQRYDTAVVGIIDRSTEDLGLINYFDASSTNTSFADGSPLTVSGPTPSSGAADNAWHLRTQVGNEGTVLSADGSGSEDAPMLMTEIQGVDAGLYDVFAYFWSDTQQDWRIEAGLDADDLMLFRMRGSQQATAEEFSAEQVIDEGTRSLYRVYVGRAEVAADEAIVVYVDDGDGGASQRAWYDGVGIASVFSTVDLAGDYNQDGVVDTADFTVWRDSLGLTGSGLVADGNSDGVVDIEDYQVWRDNFGAVSGDPAESTSAEIPEPSGIVLSTLFLGAHGALLARRSE